MATVRIVHISDLHIGVSARSSSVTSHSPEVLRALLSTLKTLLRDARDTNVLVVSGDVSAWGHAVELSMYRTMRDIGWKEDAVDQLRPLILGFDHVIDIPGNHDYWNGFLLNPWLKSLIRTKYFEPARWSLTIPMSSHLLAVDSLCSTSGADKRQQLFAVGEFLDPDVNVVEQSMVGAQQTAASQHLKLIQILVTHHSPAHGDALGRGLSLKAMRTLRGLCQRQPIDALLTGHSHEPSVDTSKPASCRHFKTGQSSAARQVLSTLVCRRSASREVPSFASCVART